ncbi:hypothetical protein JD844_003857 [Phrynosoma platyrhinos]|uniref:Vipericidin n=1 Tax=Phrynosoma platyrhinos TaxID=52577 RepID=A0ABQ7TD89_PHRPL|nr:hypothetical protein JD844_003857 [Phrynosoma platyrhinos]
MENTAMDRLGGVLFLLSLATAVPLEPPKNIQDTLPQVVAIYNQGPKVQNAFRVLEATPLPAQNSSSVILQQLNFTIQETVCPASKNVNAEECEFKPDGGLGLSPICISTLAHITGKYGNPPPDVLKMVVLFGDPPPDVLKMVVLLVKKPVFPSTAAPKPAIIVSPTAIK